MAHGYHAHLQLRHLNKRLTVVRLCFSTDSLSLTSGHYFLYIANLHRRADYSLGRGTLINCPVKCEAVFDIYVPNDLTTCSRVAVICRNPHSHPPPAPLVTPPAIVAIFKTLLFNMDWRLADATPRRIMLDSGFMQGLKHALGWPHTQSSPSLSHLHPSLTNLDHVRRILNTLRAEEYPNGTGFKGNTILLTIASY